jgi:hypothetical protein
MRGSMRRSSIWMGFCRVCRSRGAMEEWWRLELLFFIGTGAHLLVFTLKTRGRCHELCRACRES